MRRRRGELLLLWERDVGSDDAHGVLDRGASHGFPFLLSTVTVVSMYSTTGMLECFFLSLTVAMLDKDPGRSNLVYKAVRNPHTACAC
jgi:hypothetical protein